MLVVVELVQYEHVDEKGLIRVGGEKEEAKNHVECSIYSVVLRFAAGSCAVHFTSISGCQIAIKINTEFSL
jgi:hypothetical protein